MTYDLPNHNEVGEYLLVACPLYIVGLGVWRTLRRRCRRPTPRPPRRRHLPSRRLVNPSAGCLTDVPGIRVGHHQRRGRGWRTGTTVVAAARGHHRRRRRARRRPRHPRHRPAAPHRDDGRRARHLPHRRQRLRAGRRRRRDARTSRRTASASRSARRARRGPASCPAPSSSTSVAVARFANRPDESLRLRVPPAAGARHAVAARRRRRRHRCPGARAAGRGRHGQRRRCPDGRRGRRPRGGQRGGFGHRPRHRLPWMPGRVRLRTPPAAERVPLHAATSEAAVPPLNTTIGVVATTAALTKAECSKFAARGPRRAGPSRATRALAARRRHDLRRQHRPRRPGLIENAADAALPPQRSRVTWLNAVLEAGAPASPRRAPMPSCTPRPPATTRRTATCARRVSPRFPFGEMNG